MEGFQALVTIVPWNFVAQIANLLITMLLVKKFLFQRVQKILDQRQALCNAQLEEAASAREKAEQAQAMLAKAEADIAQQRKKAVNEVKDELGGIAVDIASKVVEREVRPEDHAKLIDEFIQNVGDAS